MEDSAAQLELIVETIEKLGVQVRHEYCGGGGGLCALRGQRVLYVDLSADLVTRVERSIEALASLPDTEKVFLPPTLREQVDGFRG